MKNTFLPLALRETRAQLSSKIVLMSLLGTSLILGLSGPFGSFEHLQALPRLAYWTAIVFCTYAGAIFVIQLTKKWLSPTLHPVLRDGISALSATPLIVAIVVCLNMATFSYSGIKEVLEMSIELLPYVATITVVVTIFIGQLSQSPVEKVHDKELSTLLKRLPPEKRGDLIALQAQDHYVRVITSKGETLLLLRFADAMEEAKPIEGIQTHRSFWVAKSAIKKIKPNGERGILVTKTGSEFPVSRNYMSKLKYEEFL